MRGSTGQRMFPAFTTWKYLPVCGLVSRFVHNWIATSVTVVFSVPHRAVQRLRGLAAIGTFLRTKVALRRPTFFLSLLPRMSALGQKRTLTACLRDVRFTPKADIGQRLLRAILSLQVWSLDAQDRPHQPAIRLSRKDWLLRANGAVLGPVRALAALRDPAPPAFSLRWGFGGGGDGRRTTEEVPDGQGQSKRKPASPVSDSKTKTRKSVRRTTAHKSGQLKPARKSAAPQQPRSASQPRARRESKKAHIIAMLRSPGGATIEAIAHAAKWQLHSVRGFLAGVVRKKLGLALVSAKGENRRVYRITDHTASVAA